VDSIDRKDDSGPDEQISSLSSVSVSESASAQSPGGKLSPTEVTVNLMEKIRITR
jgi:hypothetical protein